MMSKMIKKIMVPMLVMSLLLSCFVTSYGIEARETETTAMAATLAYYAENANVIDDWEVLVAIEAAGGDLNDGTYTLPTWDTTTVPTDAYGSTYGSRILGLVAMGQNPSDIWDRNLIDELVAIQGTDGAFGSPLDQIFAMLALDLVGAEYDTNSAIAALIDMQGENGGFGYAVGVEDIDSTGLALVALSNHMEEEAVRAAIEDTLVYVKSLQIETGGYASYGMENTNSISRVIMGLVAVGEDVYGQEWQVDGNTILDALYTFTLEDNAYKWIESDTEANTYATKEALIALSDVVNGQSAFKGLAVDFEVQQIHTYSDDAAISTWAKDSVYTAKEMGLLVGSGNTFAPKEEMTRGEFIQMVMTALGNDDEITVENPFTDIEDTDVYATAVLRAYQLGITNGTSATTFSPDRRINREQMAVFLAKALELSTEESVDFNDADSISSWAVNSINAVYESGILVGYNGNFYPDTEVNKETAAVMIIRVSNWIEK